MLKYCKLLLVALLSLVVLPAFKLQGLAQEQTVKKNYLENKVFAYELNEESSKSSMALAMHFEAGYCSSTMDISHSEGNNLITYRIHSRDAYTYVDGKLEFGKNEEAWVELVGTGVRKQLDPTQLPNLKAKYEVDETLNTIKVSVSNGEPMTLSLVE